MLLHALLPVRCPDCSRGWPASFRGNQLAAATVEYFHGQSCRIHGYPSYYVRLMDTPQDWLAFMVYLRVVRYHNCDF